MVNYNYTTFKGVSQYGLAHISEQCEANLIQFLNWGFLSIGAYRNVNRPTTRITGGSGHRLQPLNDPNFANGRVWQGFRKNWVWESGVEYAGTQPINISGVYVNGAFKTPTTSGYEHYVDYNRGQVVFNTALPSSSVVEADFSYKFVNVISMDSQGTYNIQYGSFDFNASHFAQQGSGDWARVGEERVQLPLVAVQVVDSRKNQGLQIGYPNPGLRVDTDILFHIYTESEFDLNNIVDIISLQDWRAFAFFDINRIASSGLMPLDYRGAKNANPKMYSFFANPANGYYWNTAFMYDTIVQQRRRVNDNLFHAIVRSTLQIDVPNV